MRMPKGKEGLRIRRHWRIRKRVKGTPQRPRLVVHRSHLHLQAQLVDDLSGKTLIHCSTQQPELRKLSSKGGGLDAARRLGEAVARSASQAGIKQVVFDRSGLPYHGRIKALAEAARQQGLVL